MEPVCAHDDQPIPASVERVARLFDVTEKTVRSWIRNGLPTLKSGGKGKGNGALLDLAIVINWYLQENALDVAKTRLASAQADKHEMDNHVRRGELADLNVVEHEWADLVLAFRAKLLGLGTKLGPRLTNVTNPAVIASRINAEVESALRELSGDDDHASADGPSEREVTNSQDQRTGKATAATNGKSVGGRKKKVK